ncbi:TIR protein [Candidatus Sulfopaludibacter sp. SbA3]|nr:TIR protein [Candidatus Sulfopaludibacter sp. SbA3]
MGDLSPAQQLAQVVVRGLEEGKTIEIDGLGIFYPDPVCGFRFEPRTLPQVFIAYVKEDEGKAQMLYDALEAAGFSPWMDVRKLLPGQIWPRAIDTAIETSDFFVPCFSSNSVSKWGGFQAEIRYALDCARRVPLEEIFIVPLRLDACRVPRPIQRELQYVDLFPDPSAGLRQLVATMHRELKRRRRAAWRTP